jgi:hypothetical protein
VFLVYAVKEEKANTPKKRVSRKKPSSYLLVLSPDKCRAIS